jgi:hypothetical protein
MYARVGVLLVEQHRLAAGQHAPRQPPTNGDAPRDDHGREVIDGFKADGAAIC